MGAPHSRTCAVGPWLGLALPLISFYPPGRDKQGWFSSLSPPAEASCATASLGGQELPSTPCVLLPESPQGRRRAARLSGREQFVQD